MVGLVGVHHVSQDGGISVAGYWGDTPSRQRASSRLNQGWCTEVVLRIPLTPVTSTTHGLGPATATPAAAAAPVVAGPAIARSCRAAEASTAPCLSKARVKRRGSGIMSDRIASTNQHPIGMVTKESMLHGACAVAQN